MGYLSKCVEGKKIGVHVLIAEKALGHKLPSEAVVHHFDGDPSNNANSNLVVCENRAYHSLLHSRQNALAACGNPDYRKCGICKQWDAPSNLKMRNRGDKGTEIYHRRCFKLRDKGYQRARATQGSKYRE